MNGLIVPKIVLTVVTMGSAHSGFCRICLVSDNESDFMKSPCLCKGSLQYIHKKCFDHWTSLSGRTTCEICQSTFYNDKPPSNDKPPGIRDSASFLQWFIPSTVVGLSLCTFYWLITQTNVGQFVWNSFLLSPFFTIEFRIILKKETVKTSLPLVTCGSKGELGVK